VKTRGAKAHGDRDRARTEEALLSAVGRLLSKSGFEDVGVNAVAREAGVDKVLIYRYFGKLPDLLRAFAERGGHWPTDAELLGDDLPADPAELAAHVLVRFGRAIRSRPETLSIMRRELSERNPLTDALAEAREQQALRLAARIGDLGVDAPAVGAIIAAGLTYLSLRAPTVQAYNGVDLHSDEGWERIERAVQRIVEALTRRSRNPRGAK
jgi:AcrR family transcriptional regulator